MLGDHSDVGEVAYEEVEEVAKRFDDPDEADDVIEAVLDEVWKREDLRPEYDKMVKEAAEYFAIYLGEVADAEPVVPNITPDSSIENLTELQEYHFLRTGEMISDDERGDVSIGEEDAATETHLGTKVGVKDFVSLLSERLRTVDTETTREVKEFDGEIRGQIDWQRTLKSRAETGVAQSQRYACRVQNSEALSTRNRVLFDLLGRLDTISKRFDQRHASGEFPDWIDDWGEGADARKAVGEALSNPHFAAVDTETVTVTQKEVKTVTRDREPLYREAAELLRRLRQINRENVGNTDARDLLGMDVFRPDEDDDEGESTVYELYWHFKIVDVLDSAGGLKSTKLDSDDDLVAAWTDEEKDSRYLLFNDWNGKSSIGDWDETEILRFAPPNINQVGEPSADGLRAGYTHQAWRKLREEGLDNKKFRTERGTPDIVLLELARNTDSPVIESVFVGEVKRSKSKYTVDEGIAQLAEYGAFAEVGDNAQLAGEPSADYVATDPNFLEDDRLELGLFVSSGHQVKTEPDEIQLCWFDDAGDGDGSVDPPLRD